MEKKKILISGVGGSLFPYLFDRLDKYESYFTDSNTIVKKIYPNQNIIIVPPVKSSEFEPFMLKTLTDLNVEYYIPLIDEEIPIAHKIAGQIKNLKLISPTLDFCELCLDKNALMGKLAHTGVSNVDTFTVDNIGTRQYPIFVKPIVGRGSRGVQKIDSNEQLAAYLTLSEYKKNELMAQEYLDGEEYTISVVVNSKNKLLAIVPKLVLQKKGITQNAVTVKSKQIELLTRKIVELLKPCGSFNIQLKIGTKPAIFEINPRFSTTTILTMEAGIDEVGLSIERFDDENVEFIEDFKEGLGIYRTPQSYFYE